MAQGEREATTDALIADRGGPCLASVDRQRCRCRLFVPADTENGQKADNLPLPV